ncbi:MAG TPA: TonB-dependent receptor [Chitinophagaceae bacterium]|nr:TonB-dependent receptor [Chitinophagaceae bacterium]
MKKMIFIVTAATIGSQLQAQQDSSSLKTLDEVIITANKYPNKTSLTGKVITIITKEQLEQSGGKDLSQVLTEQAGIYIGGANSNAGKDKSIYLRGARIDHTLIVIDGVPLYDPSGIGGNFDIRNISIANIDRIEILKGSQSTLYGSDAIAGVIHIITKKAGAKLVNSNGVVSYGSYHTFNGAAGISGKKERVDYNVNYSFTKTKGINEAASNATNADKDGYAQHSFIAGVGLHPDKNIGIQPYVRYAKINGDLDKGSFTDELDFTYSQKSFQTGIKTEFNFGKTKLNLLYSYNSINREYIDDSIKSRNGFDIYSKGKYSGYEHFTDVFAVFPISHQFKLTTGIDFRRSVSNQEYFSIGFFGPVTSQYGSDSLKQIQTGLYAALNFNGKKEFTIETGGRVNFHSTYGSYSVFNINPSYLVSKHVKLFANFSSAYRTPSLYQLFSEYGNKNLKPEAALSMETGIQLFLHNKRFISRAVAFRRNVKDIIFFYYDAATFKSQYINQDKQNDKGFELEASYAITKNTMIKVFYTYVTGKTTTKFSPAKDTTYFNLLRRPKSSFGINISSKINDRLLISSNFSVYGKRSDTYFDLQSFNTVNVTLKQYALWDVYSEYAIYKSKLKLFTGLKNILNSNYTEISGFNVAGFTANAGLRFAL